MSMMTQRTGRRPADAVALAVGRLEGRAAFRSCLLHAIETAAQRGWSHAVFCDPDFADWPLGDRTVEAALDAWARTGTHFTLLAHRYDDVTRRHARFLRWRTRWSHQIDCWQLRSPAMSALPSVFWTPDWMLHQIDPVHGVCVAGGDARRLVAMRESIDHWLHASSAAFHATTLGL